MPGPSDAPRPARAAARGSVRTRSPWPRRTRVIPATKATAVTLPDAGPKRRESWSRSGSGPGRGDGQRGPARSTYRSGLPFVSSGTTREPVPAGDGRHRRWVGLGRRLARVERRRRRRFDRGGRLGRIEGRRWPHRSEPWRRLSGQGGPARHRARSAARRPWTELAGTAPSRINRPMTISGNQERKPRPEPRAGLGCAGRRCGRRSRRWRRSRCRLCHLGDDHLDSGIADCRW